MLQQIVRSGGALQSAYVRSGDHLLGSLHPGVSEKLFAHSDGLGSIRVLSGNGGVVSAMYSFSVFGRLLENQAHGLNRYLFAGERFENSNAWYYNRARWLDPSVGRFGSMDPLGGIMEDPLSHHKYLYVGAKPADRIDPTGLTENLTSLTATMSAFIGNALTFLNTAFRIHRAAETFRDAWEWGRLAMRAWQYMTTFSTPLGALEALMRDAAAVSDLAQDGVPALDSGIQEAQQFLGSQWKDLRKRITAQQATIARMSAQVILKHTSGIIKARSRGVGNVILYMPSAPGGARKDLFIGLKGKLEMAVQITGGGRLFGLGYRTGKADGNSLQFFRIDYAEALVYDPHWHLESKARFPL